MNSAELMVTCQGDVPGAVYDRLNTLAQQLDVLTSILQDLEVKVKDSSKVGLAMQVPELPLPNRYDGKPNELRGFVCQCQLRFEIQPGVFASHKNRVAFIISLLKGKPLDWASALMQKKSPILQNSDSFTDALRRIFDTPGRKTLAAAALRKLKQGQNTVHEYALEFRILAWDTEWNDCALSVFFYEGLNEQMKDLLVSRDIPDNLEELIHHCNLLDVRLRQRQQEKEQVYQNCERPRASTSRNTSGLHKPRSKRTIA